MIDNIVTLIKECRIFASLDIEICETIAHLFEPLELEQDDILFRQDDPSHSFYILINGNLIATISAPNGSKFVGTIESGETVGELGALSGEPRTLTVKASEHSRLLKLSNHEFAKLCNHYPSIMLETIKPIISRSQKNIKLLSSGKECNYVGIILQKSSYSDKIRKKFLQNIPSDADYIFVLDSQIDHKTMTKTFSESEKKYKNIIVLFDAIDSPLSKTILNRAETIYVLVDSESNHQFEPFIESIIHNDDYRKQIKFELILSHNTVKKFPQDTGKWLEKKHFFQHHHLRSDNDTDYRRLLRFFSGNAIGLVLGGGGSRGWLHLGVIKALMEANIPIDAIGGTSVGSIVAGCYLAAQGQYEGLLEKFTHINDKSAPPFTLKDYTLPVISLMNAERLTNSVEYVCDKLNIEDLWQPFFCISSNVTTYKEQMHHIGSLFQKMRASLAIPGLLPPMVIDGHLHYDGALCNNLPVDIMRNIVGANGKIIAVRLNSHHNQNQEYHFPPILTAKDLTAQKLHIGKETYRFPPFFDTFFGVLTFGSSTKEVENAAFADILIHPDITNYGMLGLKQHQKQELVRLGYRELIEALGNWKFDKKKNVFTKK